MMMGQWICLVTDCLNLKQRKPLPPAVIHCLQGIGQHIEQWLLMFLAIRLRPSSLKRLNWMDGLKVQVASLDAQVPLNVLKTIVTPIEDGCCRLSILESAYNSWDLDAFSLANVSGNRPLSCLGLYLFQRLGLVESFRLDTTKLSRFFLALERGYDEANPYHNRAHAASVMHAMHALLRHGNLLGGGALHSKQLRTMACLFAAAVHDVEHEGLSNDFLVRTSHQKAVRWQKQHVNENHHLEAAFDLLLCEENNFLANMPPDDFERFQSLVSDLVLSTDMAQHGAIVERAKEGAGAFGPVKETLLLQLAMKCADLGHLALGWDLHLKWVACLEEELFLQGDREKELGLSVSFLMDRQKKGVTGSQVGFFDHVVLPLFRLFAQLAPGTAPMLESVEDNYQHWQEIEGSRAPPGS